MVAVAEPSGICERIKKARNNIPKLSLRDVEKITGISNALLSQIETGKIKSPSFSTIAKLCSLYGIKMESLLEEQGEQEKDKGR